VVVAIAFPIAGLIGWKAGGRVDAVDAAQALPSRGTGTRGSPRPGRARMPVLVALGWCATTVGGISVEDQFTVFGAYGAVVFMLLSGLLFARFTQTRAQAA
jgi:hypothetical protein